MSGCLRALPSFGLALAAALALPPAVASTPEDDGIPSLPVETLASPASEDTRVRLEPVVVVGTMTPRAASEVTASVSVIDSRDIEYRQASNMGEVLRDLPGVSVEGGPRANAEFINIRGLSGPRVLLLIDGIRQNFIAGHRSNLLLEPELISRVEVLRGPASALWGSDALGGVVSVTTKDADDFLEPGQSFGGRVRGGYESAARETLASGVLAARLGDFSLVGNFTQRSAEDYELPDGSRQPHTALDTDGRLIKLAWQPEGPHQLTLSHQGFEQSGLSPANPAAAVSTTNPLVDRLTTDDYHALRYRYDTATGIVRHARFGVYRSDLNVAEDRVESPRADRTAFTTDGASTQLSLALGGDTSLTLGGEYFTDDAHATRDGAPRPQYPDAERRIGGAFAQLEWPLGPLRLVPAIRWDRYRAESRTDGGPVDEQQVSPKLGLLLNLMPGLRLRASYGEAFRAPGLTEIYISGQHFPGNAFIPNPDLRPERARNLEAGLSLFAPGFGDGQFVFLDGSVYRTRVEDFIELQVSLGPSLPPDCGFPYLHCANLFGSSTNHNLGHATLRGGELQIGYEWGPARLSAQYSRVRGENDETGEPLLNIPADRVRGALDLRWPGHLRATLGYTHHARQDRVPNTRILFITMPTTSATPAYDTWDLALSYEPIGDGRWFGLQAPRLVLGVDNLGNDTYRQHLSELTSPGRNLRVSVSAGF